MRASVRTPAQLRYLRADQMRPQDLAYWRR